MAIEVDVRIWEPPGAPRGLLVVHDGPAYEEASLTGHCAAAIEAGAVAPFRVALLAARRRDESYSASALYARALCERVLPALKPAGPVVGMGARLGALAMFHAQRRFPGALQGLFLQSGSFFVPRFDRHESVFARYGRIVRFVREVRRVPGQPVPVTLTCGRDEENVHNNRLMADVLRGQGYAAKLHELPGGHDYDCWRRGLEEHLVPLLARVLAP